MARAVEGTAPVTADALDLGILERQPLRLGAGGRREEDVPALGRDAVENTVEPVEAVAAFLGLEANPGEDRDGEGVAARLLHEADVLLEDVGAIEPLVGVVVAAVEDVRETWNDRGEALGDREGPVTGHGGGARAGGGRR